MYHGGGYAVGGLDNETLLMRRWTGLGGVGVNVDYRLAPEHPFPVGVNDAYDALKWVKTISSVRLARRSANKHSPQQTSKDLVAIMLKDSLLVALVLVLVSQASCRCCTWRRSIYHH